MLEYFYHESNIGTTFFQHPARLHVLDVRGGGPPALVPCGDVHLLHSLLRRLPLLLRQHLRGPHHRHVQRAGGGRVAG